MTITLAELGTLDYDDMGEPFCSASTSSTIITGTLDYDNIGEPFVGAEAPSGAPDTALSAEFTMDLTMTAGLTTQITMEAGFTAELTMVAGYMNLGSTAKMEIIF